MRLSPDFACHAGGHAEPLTVTLAGMTGFDADDYAAQTWKVTGEDGRVILLLRVPIDGRPDTRPESLAAPHRQGS